MMTAGELKRGVSDAPIEGWQCDGVLPGLRHAELVGQEKRVDGPVIGQGVPLAGQRGQDCLARPQRDVHRCQLC